MARRGSYDGIGAEGVYKEERPESLAAAVEPVLDLFAREKYDEVVDSLRSLKKLFPYAGALYATLAMALDRTREHESALEAMLPAVSLEPNNPEMWKMSARVAYINGCEIDAVFLEVVGGLLEDFPPSDAA